jgi:class 3 adenylate cyclase
VAQHERRETLQEWAGVGASKTTLALVFTDIVGSTALGNRLGDDKWIELLMRHFTRARSLTEQYDCYEIKVIGDSFMVAFRTAYEALRFTMDFYCDTGDPQIGIRAGIHLGQVRIIDNDLYGRMVNFTSRVEHSIEGSGIAVSASAVGDIKAELGDESREVIFRSFSAKVKESEDTITMYRALSRAMRLADVERRQLNPPVPPQAEKSPSASRPFIVPREEPIKQPSEKLPRFRLAPRNKDVK